MIASARLELLMHDLSLAARVAFGKSRGLWLDLHVSQAQFAPSPAPPLTTWFSAL